MAAICAVDRHLAAGKRVQVVVTQHPIEGVVDVDAIDVPVAGPAQIHGANLMGLKHADRIGPHQESVPVKHQPVTVVLVVMDAELRRVARPNEVLSKIVGDRHRLISIAKRVQPAVGVFLQLIEHDRVVLIAIRIGRAEDAHTPRLTSAKMKPRKSLTNGCEPARTETKS